MKKLLFFTVLLNLVTHIWSATPELKELMRQSQPFDRGSPLSASVDALITSKKGKETLMKYNMYTLRGDGKINVMIFNRVNKIRANYFHTTSFNFNCYP